MNTQPGPVAQPHTIPSVSLELICSYFTMELVLFHLSLNVHAHLQYISIYYQRDPQYDPHHPVDPKPEKRHADQQERVPY